MINIKTISFLLSSIIIAIIYLNGIHASAFMFLVILIVYIYLLLNNFIPAVLISLLLPLAFVYSGIADNNIYKVWSMDVIYILFCGIIISESILKCGISDKIVYIFLKYSNNSFINLSFILGCIGMVLVFIIPSATCRGIIMITLCVSLIKKLEFSNKDASCLMLCGYFATSCPRFMNMFGGISEIFLINTYNQLGYVYINYFNYLLYMLVPGIIYTVLCISMTLFVLNPEKKIKTPELLKFDNYIPKYKLCIYILFFLGCIASSVVNFKLYFVFMLTVICIFICKILNNDDIRKINFLPVFVFSGILVISSVATTSGFTLYIHDIMKYINFNGSVIDYMKVYFYSIISTNVITIIPTISSTLPLMLNNLENTVIGLYSFQYGLDQLFTPVVFPLLMYFYDTQLIRVYDFYKVFLYKFLMSTVYIYILINLWFLYK